MSFLVIVLGSSGNVWAVHHVKHMCRICCHTTLYSNFSLFQNISEEIISSVKSFGKDLQIAHTPTIESLYGNYQAGYAVIPNYNGNLYLKQELKNDIV